MNTLERETKVPEAATTAPATTLTPAAAPAPAKLSAHSAEEEADFLAADKAAALAVVGIMTAIFTAALVGYTFIAWWVWMY